MLESGNKGRVRLPGPVVNGWWWRGVVWSLEETCIALLLGTGYL